VDLEDADLALDVLQVRRRRLALRDDDLRLLRADVDAVADEREGRVLERTLVAVQIADRRERRRLDPRPLRVRRRVEDDHALIVLLGEAELARPARIGVSGARDVVRLAGGLLGWSGVRRQRIERE